MYVGVLEKAAWEGWMKLETGEWDWVAFFESDGYLVFFDHDPIWGSTHP